MLSLSPASMLEEKCARTGARAVSGIASSVLFLGAEDWGQIKGEVNWDAV